MTTFIVNGKQHEVEMRVNGIDISADFIGNTAHGMDYDDEGRLVCTKDDLGWWKQTIAAHLAMDETIARYKEQFDPGEVEDVVYDWGGGDLDQEPAQVLHGLEQVFGKV